MNRPYCIVMLLCLLYHACIASPVVNPRDSVRITALLDSAMALEGKDRKAALDAYREIVRQSDDAGYTLGKAKALHYSAIVYSDENQYEQSVAHYREAARFYRAINNARGIGACYGNVGNLLLYQGKLDSALSYYHTGIRIFEQHGIRDALSQMYGNTGVIFERLKQYDKAGFYFDRSLALAMEVQDSVMLCRALTNKATLLFDLERYDEAVSIHHNALSIAEKIGDNYSIQVESINLADSYNAQGINDKAIRYGLKALETSLQIGTPFDIADIKRRVGDMYASAGQGREAERFYFEAIAIANNIDAMEIKAAGYHSLQTLYAQRGDYKGAYKFQALAGQYDDSVLNEKQFSKINELEVRYQTLQKDKALEANRAQLLKSRQYIVYSSGAAVIAMLLAALIVVYYRSKRNTYRRQLEAVNREKEMQVLQAMMQGEEKERSRIAYTLHDEVSGMLAAAKMHLDTAVGTLSAFAAHSGYQKVMSLLDETSSRVRNTAHNLLPEVLIQNGLAKALEKYCRNISNDQRLSVAFYALTTVPRYPHNFELAIYRIVQELLNNILKHANASTVMVQVAVEGTTLSITVEDDGIGFTTPVESTGGIGLTSLAARVKALNGRIDISSEPGSGVSIYIEFDVDNIRDVGASVL